MQMIESIHAAIRMQVGASVAMRDITVPSRSFLRETASSSLAMAAAALLALSAVPDQCFAQSMGVIQGPARVVDGDTLAIGGEKIRFFGVDAPEKAQTCR